MELGRTILMRLLLVAVTVAAGVVLSAMLVRYAPGFGADERTLDARLTGESLEAIRRETREERDITSYLVGAIQRMLNGDLGRSRALQRPVRQLLAERGRVTLQLVGNALALAWAVAVFAVLAIWLARSAVLTVACDVGSGMLLCLPAGAVALLLILADGPGYLALALVVFPKVYRYLTSLVRATGRKPHVLAAKAKGVPEVRLLLWHVVPAIRRELLALGGVSVGLAVSAAIPVEALCGIPGIGQLAWQSALARDVPVLLQVSLLVIGSTVLANSGADLLAEDRRLAG